MSAQATPQVTLLCLVRHGETAWNAEGRVQGQTDVPLNVIGAAQANAVGAALALKRFAAVYSSDLTRVRQTAEPAAQRLGLAIRYDAALRERHYGMFETHTYREVRERFPEDYARFRQKELDYDFRGGESLRLFNQRALGCVRSLAARHSGESILVFTHGGVLEMVYRHANALGLSAPREFGIPNGAINWVEVAGESWSVRQWAQCAHLENAIDDLPG